jgi:hypothetical protein
MILNHRQSQSAKNGGQLHRKSNKNLKERAAMEISNLEKFKYIGLYGPGHKKNLPEICSVRRNLCPAMSRHFFPTLDSHLFVCFLSLFFWFSCAFSCSSEPAISQTGTSIHESASLFGMAAISNHDLHFSISAKIESYSDSIKIANEVSTYINYRSLKIVMLNETSSLNALELNFLVHLRDSITAKAARRSLIKHIRNALGNSTQTLVTCKVTECQSNQTNRLELSECTRIEWTFCCSCSPVVTALSSEAQSNVTEQQNPNGDSQATAEAVFSCDSALADASLGLRVSETSSITAAGVHPSPFMVAKTY